MTRDRRPNILHGLAAGVLVLAALPALLVGYVGFIYAASAGCEDYPNNCHDADPVRAVTWVLATVAVVTACLLLAAALMASSRDDLRRRAVRGAWAGFFGGALVAAALLMV